MGNNPKSQSGGLINAFQEKNKRFRWVRDYIVSSYNDGYAFEDPVGFRREVEQFLEPVIADQIEAIEKMSEMEMELLKRDAHILFLEAEIALERSLKRIFNQIDQAAEDFVNNADERELLKEIKELSSMEITPENAAEHNARMRDALRKAKDVMNPAERQTKLKSTMNKAIFGVDASYRDEMIMPLRRLGLSREQREDKFQNWLSRHYDL